MPVFRLSYWDSRIGEKFVDQFRAEDEEEAILTAFSLCRIENFELTPVLPVDPERIKQVLRAHGKTLG